mgnify:CR=1 FL=1
MAVNKYETSFQQRICKQYIFIEKILFFPVKFNNISHKNHKRVKNKRKKERKKESFLHMWFCECVKLNTNLMHVSVVINMVVRQTPYNLATVSEQMTRDLKFPSLTLRVLSIHFFLQKSPKSQVLHNNSQIFLDEKIQKEKRIQKEYIEIK